MDKQLRDLAFGIVHAKKVDSVSVNVLIEKLSVKDLEKFLGYMRIAQENNTITITAAEHNATLVDYFEKKYSDKTVSFQTDKTIGGGVIVKIADDVYDYSVRNYIETTIERLNEEL